MASDDRIKHWCGTCGVLDALVDLDINMDCRKCSNWWKDNPPPSGEEQLELPL